MLTLQSEFAVLVPVLIALLYGLRSAGIPSKLIPLSALLGGIIIGLFIKNGDVVEGLQLGFLLSATAIGTHSGLKNTIENKDK
jgi:hypothetical protein